jgi:hypothetical protein
MSITQHQVAFIHKQQVAAASLVIVLVPLILKDIAWPEPHHQS